MRVFRTKPLLVVAVLATMALAIVACEPTPSGLVADYRFQDTLVTSVGSSPPLKDITDKGSNTFPTDTVDGVSRRVLRFPQGNGLKLQPTDGVPMPTDHYTVAILFRFADVSSYRRILQTKDDNSAAGLYVVNGVICFYGMGGNMVTIQPDIYVQVVAKRSPAGNYFVYVNGVLALDKNPDQTQMNATIASGHQLRFFDDDNTIPPNDQESAGRVARIRIWDRALTEKEIKSLHHLP